MRFVDADYLIALGNEDGANGFVSVEDIKDAPTIFTTPVAVKSWMNKADLVEVVRCKDCRWHEYEEPGMVYCPLVVGDWVEEDWFCKGGERKDTQ